jgi:hypothetical protein
LILVEECGGNDGGDGEEEKRNSRKIIPRGVELSLGNPDDLRAEGESREGEEADHPQEAHLEDLTGTNGLAE